MNKIDLVPIGCDWYAVYVNFKFHELVYLQEKDDA